MTVLRKGSSSGRRSAYYVLAASILSTVMAIALALVTLDWNKPLPPAATEYLLIALALVCLSFVIYTSLRGAIEELRELNRESIRGETLNKCVPTSVTFVRRTDEVNVLRNGDVDISWRLTIRKDTGRALPQLHFPLYGDLFSITSPEETVYLEEVRVGAEDRTRQSRFRVLELQKLYDTGTTRLYGVLIVDVNFDRHTRTREVSVKLRFRRGSDEASLREGDTYSVDIPYVTEHLEVRIRSPEGVEIPSADRRRPIRCGPGLMNEDFDAEEEEARVEEYASEDNPSANTLFWRTSSPPKLGYRYRVRFRVLA